MASRTKVQHYADGTSQIVRRAKQGRKPCGFGKPTLVRLYVEDEEKINALSGKYGIYWNFNEFVRDAVREKLSNSVYTELLKS